MKIEKVVSTSYQAWVSAMEEVTKNGSTDSYGWILTLCLNLVPTSDVSYYFLVFRRFLPTGAELERKAIEQGFLVVKESEVSYQKPSSMTENESETVINDSQKPSSMTENESKTVISEKKPSFQTTLIKNVYEAICLNPKIKYSQLEENLGVAESTIQRAIGWLKENGYINSERSKVKGVWQIEK